MTRSRRGGALATGVAAALVAGLVAAAGSLGAAGLKTDTLRLEAEATPGLVGRVTVTNPSTDKISVTMTSRRWLQSSTGALRPDLRRKGVLAGVVSAPRSFSLAAGKSRVVEVDLKRTPASHYLYASLVARGVSASKKPGLRPSYQIAIALSLRPPAARQRYRLLASRPRVRKRKGGGVLIDTLVRNRGNMVTPPTGTIVVTRGRATHKATVLGRVGILPNGRVRIPAVAVRGLTIGRYRVKITLQQRSGGNGGRTTASNTFRVLRGGRVAH
ncbi:MAG TPA: hypothetical protein VHZ31_03640 [Solirubrobacteraceae bacterium]|nr:hypothetical protein [Solirubrobacteraceae bacterium]